MVILTIIIALIPFILIIALFTRKGFIVTAALTIQKPIQSVFDYLRLLRNQDDFHHWLMIDPKMNKTFTGQDGSVGCIYAWHSKNPKVGTASQKLVRVDAPNTIEIEVSFEKPLKSQGQLLVELTALSGAETNVRWTFNGNPRPYYLLRVGVMLFMVRRAVKKGISESLLNLKKLLEKSF